MHVLNFNPWCFGSGWRPSTIYVAIWHK